MVMRESLKPTHEPATSRACIKMNQPSVLSCVVPVFPATSARRHSGRGWSCRCPGRWRRAVASSSVPALARQESPLPRRGSKLDQHPLPCRPRCVDYHRRDIVAAVGHGGVSSHHFVQGNRAGSQRQHGTASSLLWYPHQSRHVGRASRGAPTPCITCAVMVFFE